MKPNWSCPGGETVVIPDRNLWHSIHRTTVDARGGPNHRPAFACRVSRSDGDAHAMSTNPTSDADSPDTDARIDAKSSAADRPNGTTTTVPPLLADGTGDHPDQSRVFDYKSDETGYELNGSRTRRFVRSEILFPFLAISATVSLAYQNFQPTVYNYLRSHQALDNQPPVEAAGLS